MQKWLRKKQYRSLHTHILNHNSEIDDPVSDRNLEQAKNRWLAGVKLHDRWSPTNKLFNDKVRGHGQVDGSTDGRLLRKLIKAASQEAEIKTSNNEDLSITGRNEHAK
jgi:hypothetical protein